MFQFRTTALMSVTILILGLLGSTRQALAQSGAGWGPRLGVSVTGTYDDNPFRLTSTQQGSIGSSAGKFADMDSPDDFVNDLRLRAELRGPGLADQRLRIGTTVTASLYSRNQRKNRVTIGAYVKQRLSTRDQISFAADFSPSDFRRTYMVGVDALGAPVFGAGVARTLSGELGYEHRLINGRHGAPDVDLTLAVLGRHRRYENVPWRNRNLLAGRIGAEAKLFRRLEAGVSAEFGSASHNTVPEPVVGPSSIDLRTLDRDFSQVGLGAEVGLLLTGRSRISVSYERRTRSFSASLAQDPVYGDREDTRNTYGAELRLGASRLINLRLGGRFREQFSFRPGSGDTGDEIDYRRSSVYVRLDVNR